MEEIFLQHPHTEWLARLEKSELPYGEVRNIGQVVTITQVIAREMIQQVDSPVGRIPVTSSPLRLSESPAQFKHIPPWEKIPNRFSTNWVTATRKSKRCAISK